MIPFRDVIPSRTKPLVTVSLIVLSGIGFVYQLALARAAEDLVLRYGLIPGAFSWPMVFTSMFLHSGFVQFGSNMLCLWIFGNNVEDRIGHDRFLVFYLLCGAAAVLAQTIANPESIVPTVGASGAVAGVMGAYFVLYPRSRVLALVPILFSVHIIEVPAIFFSGLWLVAQLVSTVALWGHLAGVAVGAGAVVVFKRPERQRVEWWDRATRSP